ncbi:MAG: Crp/Fnr family transcriptional regulator [Bacteroidetes bacterium]|nr:Crp/Fnr family transcriptional regulator [Bacteroidota bacterium]
MEQLLSHFLGKGIPQSELSRITESFKFKKIPKNDYFVQEGKTSKYLAFITKGVFQYFYLKDGKEITTYVTGANAFLASLSSFYKQKPSKENIRALADSELWIIHHDDLTKLKTESNVFRTFYIRAMEDLVVAMDETRTNLIILTAEERYALLVKEEPDLLQQIPLQYLASILGVTPRHLSRIRNK